MGEEAKGVSSEEYVHSTELQTLMVRLRRERVDRGMSLADIARASQQARSAISRLENGKYANPTLNTLYRYAHALGMHIRLSAEPLEAVRREGVGSSGDPGRA